MPCAPSDLPHKMLLWRLGLSATRRPAPPAGPHTPQPLRNRRSVGIIATPGALPAVVSTTLSSSGVRISRRSRRRTGDGPGPQGLEPALPPPVRGARRADHRRPRRDWWRGAEAAASKRVRADSPFRLASPASASSWPVPTARNWPGGEVSWSAPRRRLRGLELRAARLITSTTGDWRVAWPGTWKSPSGGGTAEAMKKAVGSTPVTVKVRLGWNDDARNVLSTSPRDRRCRRGCTDRAWAHAQRA